MPSMWNWGLVAVLALSLSGCGVPVALSTPGGQAQSAGLFSPKIPADQVLAAADRAADFDRYLEIATAGAKAWSAKAQLVAAQASAIDETGAKAGGTTYAFTFASGRQGLAVTIAGNTISYAEAKADTPLDSQGLVSGKTAMATAMQLGKLSHESYLLVLQATPQGPVYVIREYKVGGNARVTIEARTGRVIG